MNYLRYIIVIIIFSQILSCTKSYTYDFDDIEKHMVVNSFFSPDSLIRFHITEEASLSDDITFNGYKVINSAQIVIYENETIVDTAFYTEKGNYYSDIKPQLNTKYKISVIAPEYDKIIAEDQIPTVIKIDSLISTQNSDDFYNSRVKILFNDPGNEDNYYFLYASWKEVIEENGVWWTEASIRTKDPSIGEWQTKSFQFPIFNDELFNGQKYELTVDLHVDNYFCPGYCYFELRSISKNMYLYLKSYNKQTPKFGDDMMEMFQQGMIEPIPIYTNIEGGLGIFGGYAVSQDSVYFE